LDSSRGRGVVASSLLRPQGTSEAADAGEVGNKAKTPLKSKKMARKAIDALYISIG
jgi:hypothetical protein